MSMAILSWAFSLRLKPLQKLIIITMAELVNQDGFCIASLAKISDLTGIKPDSLQNHLQALEKLKVIKSIEETPNETLVFKLNIAYSNALSEKNRGKN